MEALAGPAILIIPVIQIMAMGEVAALIYYVGLTAPLMEETGVPTIHLTREGSTVMGGRRAAFSHVTLLLIALPMEEKGVPTIHLTREESTVMEEMEEVAAEMPLNVQCVLLYLAQRPEEMVAQVIAVISTAKMVMVGMVVLPTVVVLMEEMVGTTTATRP
jgi:hypothetical protein